MTVPPIPIAVFSLFSSAGAHLRSVGWFRLRGFSGLLLRGLSYALRTPGQGELEDDDEPPERQVTQHTVRGIPRL